MELALELARQAMKGRFGCKRCEGTGAYYEFVLNIDVPLVGEWRSASQAGRYAVVRCPCVWMGIKGWRILSEEWEVERCRPAPDVL